MNNALKCIIVDDEEGAHLVLEHYIKNLDSLELAGSFYTATEAMAYLHKQRVDLMFLDINMAGISGLQLLQTLSDPPLVVMTTAYREHALEGYKYRVVDYMVKPFDFQRFLAAIDSVFARLRPRTDEPKTASVQPPDYIILKVDGEMVKVPYDRIAYIQSWGNYIKVHTGPMVYLGSLTTTEIERKLDKTRFRRIHKSYIVALDRIRKISGGQVELNDGTLLPIGSTYRRDLIENFR